MYPLSKPVCQRSLQQVRGDMGPHESAMGRGCIYVCLSRFRAVRRPPVSLFNVVSSHFDEPYSRTNPSAQIRKKRHMRVSTKAHTPRCRQRDGQIPHTQSPNVDMVTCSPQSPAGRPDHTAGSRASGAQLVIGGDLLLNPDVS